jgi:hypothetical protein
MKNAIALIALSSLLISGCGKETDADKIADAQACLDQATPSNVSDCVDKVSGVSGKGAELIRCVAVYVKQEKTAADTIEDLFNAIQTPGGGSSALMTGMTPLIFSKYSPTENKDDAADAADHCNASNSPGLAMLSTLSLTATVITGGSGSAFAGSDLSDCATNPSVCTGPDKALIGTAANLAYQQNCSGGAESAGDLCTQLGAVIGAGSSEDIGNRLLFCLNTPDSSCTGF